MMLTEIMATATMVITMTKTIPVSATRRLSFALPWYEWSAVIGVSLPLFAQNFTLWYDTGRVTAQGWRK
jgi:hypothetical protein